MKIGWDPPDLNEFEIDNDGYAHRKPRHGRRMIAAMLIALAIFSAVATCKIPDMVDGKFPPPTPREQVSADARYP